MTGQHEAALSAPGDSSDLSARRPISETSIKCSATQQTRETDTKTLASQMVQLRLDSSRSMQTHQPQSNPETIGRPSTSGQVSAAALGGPGGLAASADQTSGRRSNPVIRIVTEPNRAETQAPSSANLVAGQAQQAAASPGQAHVGGGGGGGGGGGQWLAAAANQTRQDIGQRMSNASDQLNLSLRQLYASASSIAAVDTLPPSYHNIPGVVPYYHGRSIGPPPSYDDVINPYAPPPSYQSLFGQMREARKTSRGLIDLLRRLLIILVSTLGCTLLLAFMILIPFTMIIIGAIYIDECQIEHIPAFLLVGGLVWASKNILHCYGQCKQQQLQEQEQLAGGLDALAIDLYQSSSSSSDTSSSTGSSGARHDQQASNVNSLLAQEEEQQQQQQEQAEAGSHTRTPSQPNATRRRLEPATSPTTTGAPALQARRQHRDTRQDQLRLKSSICESLLNCLLFGWFIAGCVIIFRNYEPDFEHSTSARYCNRTVYMYTFWLISSALLLFGLFIGCVCCLMVSSAVSNRQSHLEMDLA